MRVRGLKSEIPCSLAPRKASHPMRVRGLKSSELPLKMLQGVAPHAGAWIEMLLSSLIQLTKMVAPHAGAWIEIDHSAQVDCTD